MVESEITVKDIGNALWYLQRSGRKLILTEELLELERH